MATENDRCVLNSIFNPNLPFLDEDPSQITNNFNEAATSNDEESAEIVRAKELEVAGVKYAEDGDVHAAIEAFSSAIELAPSRASCYNNRAQAYRLLGNNPAALDDLNRAIELSGGKGSAAAKALCQRGLLERLKGETDAALRDFESAAALGCSFAKSLAVQLNPYAALCNQMLSQVVQKLQNPI